MDYSDADLLAMAFNMLREARAQVPKRLEWLDNNETMAEFRKRIATNSYFAPDDAIGRMKRTRR